jgi:hypothetical protein
MLSNNEEMDDMGIMDTEHTVFHKRLTRLIKKDLSDNLAVDESCVICYELFDKSERKPILLYCDNIICRSCLNDYIEMFKNAMLCPYCNINHCAETPDEIHMTLLQEINKIDMGNYGKHKEYVIDNDEFMLEAKSMDGKIYDDNEWTFGINEIQKMFSQEIDKSEDLSAVTEGQQYKAHNEINFLEKCLITKTPRKLGDGVIEL